MKPEGFRVDGLADKNFTRIQALMMIKKFNSNNRFETDHRFLSNADVPAVVCGAAGIVNEEIGSDPTDGIPLRERIIDNVKTDSWRWETLSTSRKYNFEWHYKVNENLFLDKNWEKQ
jgi:hypothetical protein